MIHPVLIHHPEEDDPLQLPHDGGGDLGLLGLVGLFGGLAEALRQLVAAEGGSVRDGDGVLGEELALERAEELLIAGLVQMGLLAEGHADLVADGGVHHGEDGLLDVLAVQDLAALTVDDLALLVHDVVVLQHALTGLEVPALHGGLGVLDGFREHLALERSVLIQGDLLHHVLDALAAEEAQQIVLQRDVEAALAGVALTAGTAPELVIDPAGIVALGADDEEAAGGADLLRLLRDDGLVVGHALGKEGPGLQDLLVVGLGVAGGVGDDLLAVAGLHEIGLGQVLGVAAQHDVGAAACHVGGHGDGPQLAGLGHDLGFLLVVLGVQHVVADALPGEKAGEGLVLLNGDGAHQDGLALLVALLHLRDDGPVLALHGLVDGIVVVDPGHGTVGGDLDDIQVIDGAELLLLGHGGAGHAGELAVEPEVVLEGDGGQGLILAVDADVLLGLDGLVEAGGVAAAEHETAGELIHDDDLAVLHHVVDVPLHDAVGLDGLVDVVGDGGVLGVGEVVQVEELLRLGDAPGGEGGRLGLLVHDVVGFLGLGLLLLGVHLGHDALAHPGDQHLRHVVELGGFLALAGDDEGGPGLIDEDGVHLVHDGEGVAPLDQLAGVDAHIVPEVVEAHLVVGAVGDVRGVGFLALLGAEAVDDEADFQPQEAVDLAHPLAVALGQVIVHRHDVDALAGEGVEVGGEGGHQGLALAGLHLGDAALMEDHAAHQLHPVGPQAQHPVRRLPHGGEGLRQQVIQALALGVALLELVGLGPELGVRQRAVLVLQRLHLVHQGVDGLQLPVAVGAEELCHKTHIRSSFLYAPVRGGYHRRKAARRRWR